MKWQRMFSVVMLGLGFANYGQGQHSDVELFDDAGQVATEPRIAEGEFGESPNPAYRADEPGLESDPEELALHGESPLPGGALVGFNIVEFVLGGSAKSLFYWNGSGSPDFASLEAPHELKVSDATESLSVQIDGGTSAAGFNFALTADGSGPEPAGFLHSHLMYDLVDAAGAGVGGPAEGVYVFATTFSVAGLTDSAPIYWVLACEVDEEVHEAAIDYISENVGIVPEPGTLLLAVSSLLFGILRRGRFSQIERLLSKI